MSSDRGLAAGLAPAALAELVARAGLDAVPRRPGKASVKEVLSYEGRKYKVRAYPTDAWAERQLQLVREAPDLFAPCVARIGRHLILEYVSGSDPGDGPDTMAALGAFLAELASRQTRHATDDAFESWCRNIETSRILSSRTVDSVRRLFAEALSWPVRWGLEYYDAKLSNFVSSEQGTLVAIDEKHLRVGPRGLSLIRPWRLLPEGAFAELERTYRATAGSVPIDDPDYRRFLLLYHLTFALAFNVAGKPMEMNIRDAGFQWRRQALARIAGGAAASRLHEDATWQARSALLLSSQAIRQAWSRIQRRA